MKATFLDIETYTPDQRHRDHLLGSHDDWAFYDATSQDEVVERLQGIEILVTNKVKITREILDAAKDVKIIVEAATGYDNIDVAAARDHNIPVCNVRGYSTEAVAQHTFMLLSALYGSLMPYHELVQNGTWAKSESFSVRTQPFFELHGKTLGIFGHGEIGQAVERIARAFGMDVLIADRKGADTLRDGRIAFDDVIAKADVLTVHCPLNDETRGLIGAAELTAMKDSAIVLNVSRGGIVDEAALAEALQNKYIAGAGLDVLTQEPPVDGNILLDLDMPNLIITPHCAWASVEARLRMFEEIARIVSGYKNGEIINRVN